MENTFYLVLTNSKISSRFRSTFTYFSILLFVGLVTFVSSSISKYVGHTVSLNVVEPVKEFELETPNIQEGISEVVVVKKGDTLKSILLNQKLLNSDIVQIIKLIKDHGIGSFLKIGQEIVFDYDIKIIESEGEDLTSEVRNLNKITIAIDKSRFLEVIREGNSFVVKNTTITLDKVLDKFSVVISSNLMAALKSLGLSSNSIIEIINSYSYQIDFQRQVKNGDIVTIITEKFLTKDGKFSHYGKVLYVSLNLSDKEYNIYRYSYSQLGKKQIFFSEDGKSVKRSLLRTPVNIVRISSHYGNRRHPTLGYNKMHKGVDFAAPTNTPFYAAGNGVVTEMEWKNGYGKFIQIKHSSTLSTAYAHASSFAKNLKVGSVVKQGQVIAYVGSTGRVTGPHLHYEVKINGKNVDPMSIKTTPGIMLSGKELVQFKQFKDNIKSLSYKLDNKLEIVKN